VSPEKSQLLRRVGIGALLGLGAPAGFFVLSAIRSGLYGRELAEFCWRLIPEQLPIFLYLTIPTVCVFTAFAAYTAVQERKLKKQKDQMEAFLLVASHDIKSPLMVIREGLAMICEANALTGLPKVLLDASSRQAEIMTELVTELLDIQRMEHGKGMEAAELMEIKDILRRAVEEMSPQLEKKHGTVRWESNIPAAAVNVNVFRMRQVVRNLLGNAIRYMPEGSAITVRLDSAPADRVRVSIQNSGPRIPEAHLKTIFDKFTQSGIRDYKLGHGLGLVICKNIIEGFKGRIWAENLEPTGASFVFELPIAKNPS
jgi:two-component system sensor histidine kinase GlrK